MTFFELVARPDRGATASATVAVMAAPWPIQASVFAVDEAGTVYVPTRWLGPDTGTAVPVSTQSGRARTAYPRVDGRVLVVVSDNEGGWFIGGAFDRVGNAERRNVAHILPDGSISPWRPDPEREITTIVVTADTIYVGGDFMHIAGEPRGHAAAFDRATGEITPWNPDLDGAPYAIAVETDAVYLGGTFNTARGRPRRYLAAVDAETGIATSWSPDPDYFVWTLASLNERLYVGGQFETIAGDHRAHVAAVDMATGELTPWDPSADDIVTQLIADGADLYIGGYFTTIGGADRRAVAKIHPATGRATDWNTELGGEDRTVRLFSIVAGPETLYASWGESGLRAIFDPHITAFAKDTGRPTGWATPAATAYSLALFEDVLYLGGTQRVGGVQRNGLAAIDAVTGAATRGRRTLTSRFTRFVWMDRRSSPADLGRRTTNDHRRVDYEATIRGRPKRFGPLPWTEPSTRSRWTTAASMSGATSPRLEVGIWSPSTAARAYAIRGRRTRIAALWR